MKTQKAKLQFGKSSVTELNDKTIKGINGGCQWSNSSGPTTDIKISIIRPPVDTDTVITPGEDILVNL